jgi:hypothetical protein
MRVHLATSRCDLLDLPFGPRQLKVRQASVKFASLSNRSDKSSTSGGDLFQITRVSLSLSLA